MFTFYIHSHIKDVQCPIGMDSYTYCAFDLIIHAGSASSANVDLFTSTRDTGKVVFDVM